MANQTAVVWGSTGLIGSALVDLLVKNNHFQRVLLPVRKINPERNHPKLHQVMVDFSNLEESNNELAGDTVFLCLGTTMAKEKSKPAFYAVDYTYTCQAAMIACELNPEVHLLVVTSMGADINSFFYYSRVKGEVEQKLSSFPCKFLSIFRPSLLLGQRKEKRLGEALAIKMSPYLNFLWRGPLASLKPIHASVVAGAMVRTALHPRQEKIKIFLSDQIQSLG